MPIVRRRNVDFFKHWSPEMAYVLGFFTADGCLIKNKRGACFIEFQITDKEILFKIRSVIGSNHKISERNEVDHWKRVYRLQIGSKEYYNDLKNIGLKERKSKIVDLPDIPEIFFPDFVRGFFDGDGNVYTNDYKRKGRKTISKTLLTGFTSGSKKILEKLHTQLKRRAKIKGGSLFCSGGVFRLNFSVRDSGELYRFMYYNDSELFLERKKVKFEEYFEYAKPKLDR